MKSTHQHSNTKPIYKNPQKILTLIGVILALLIGFLSYQYSGMQYVVLFITGILIGFTLFHARFGFSSVYRQIVEDGNTEMLRGHMLMLGMAATFFAPIFILELGFFGSFPTPAMSPISIGLIVGSFLFGFGMEVGSGLAPASLYKVEGARTAMIFTLFGFTGGATLGAAHFGFWNETLPSSSPISLATGTPFGYPGAWVMQISVFALIAISSYLYKKKKRPPALPSAPSGTNWKQILFGFWPLWVGALTLAALNALTLLIRGEPWVLTAAFSLWGSKIAMFFGLDVSTWGYFGTQEDLQSLHSSVFESSTSVLNFGVIIGTFITLTLGGLIHFAKISFRIGLIALIGGTLMGYGATLAFGANVGAYFSGIASFSLHAWIWAIFAITGVYVAYYLEKRLDFRRVQSKN